MNPIPHVLVADDDEPSRIYFSRQLRQYNLNVTAVENGSQVICWLKKQPFDLILLDILMPELNGFQTLEIIKTDPDFKHIPVIMVSGLDDLDSLAHCIEMGAEDYLFKPLNPVLLKARINACLERKWLRDQEKSYLEQLKAEKAAAESANWAKSVFLANMSHELRTPLNAIIGYSEILREDLQEIDASLVPDLDKIRSSGKHLLGLINDILDISKIEAGKMDLYLEHFDIAFLIQEVAQTAQPWVEKNGSSFSVHCPKDLGTMHTDLSKVRQILLNLLSNAAKFTEKGTVRLAVERRQEAGARSQESEGIGVRDGGLGAKDWKLGDRMDGSKTSQNSELQTPNSPTPHIAFIISDTGIGISPDQQETIFEAFNQGDNSSTRKYSGTGLGLALSRRFCQMLGGTISVKSTPGCGSTFTVSLPVDMVDHQVTTVLASEPLDYSSPIESVNLPDDGGLILVIDDDRTVRDLMVKTLNQEGFRVVTTWCGEEGRRLARELRPCLVLLDLMMPEVDSWAVLSAFKSDPALAEIPVVMLAIANDQSIGFTLGFSDYLTRPADFKRLTLLLRSYRPGESGGKILLVQEDATTRQIVQRLLEKEGWTVEIAENSYPSLEVLSQDPPNLVLLDLMPPDLKGSEFIANLRQHEQLHDLPVVVITAQDISRDERLWLNGCIETLFQHRSYSREKSLVEVRKLVTICARSRVCV